MITEMDIIARLLAATLLGALIGLERELSKGSYTAGLRTHALVCVGSCLFTVMSINFGGTTDPSRIAAGIVTGIGFLGAGLIFKDAGQVRGLTSAANIWTASAIGLAVGLGYYFIGVVAAVLAIIILIVGRILEHKVVEPAVSKRISWP